MGGPLSSDRRRVGLWMALLGWFCALSATAGQLHFVHYDNLQGLPQRQVITSFQDARGYLWFGTYGGLSRFNGQHFRIFTAEDGLPSNVIRDIDQLPDGRIVLAPEAGGVCFLGEDEQVECVRMQDGVDLHPVRRIAVGPEGVWVARDDGLARIRDGRIEDYSDGLPDRSCTDVSVDAQGQVWVATTEGLFRGGSEGFEPVAGTPPGARFNVVDATAQGIFAVDQSGAVWRSPGGAAPAVPYPVRTEPGDPVATGFSAGADGTLWASSGRGLYRCREGACSRITLEDGLTTNLIWDVTVDRERSVWVGGDAGVTRLTVTSFRAFGSRAGLPNDFVRGVREGKDGRLWVATRGGVAVRDPGSETFHSIGEHSDEERFYAVLPLDDGSLLYGGSAGLYHRDGGAVRRWREPEGLISNVVYALEPALDREGIWVGTRGGLMLWRDGKLTHPFSEPFTLPIVAMDIDRSGRLWMGLMDGGAARWTGETLEVFRKADGLTDQTVWDVCDDGHGGVWLGTNGEGLFHAVEDGFDRLNRADGLVNDFVWQVLVDSQDNLWAFTNQGLARFDGQRFKTYGSGDGLLDIEGSAAAATETGDGRLWFGTAKGLHEYQPEFEAEQLPVPNPVIEGVFATNAGAVLPGQRLAHDHGTLQVSVATLGFRAPQSFLGRYRLRGEREPWSPLSSDGTLSIAQLPPGDYELQVAASRDGSAWTDPPAQFVFTVAPPLWASTGFKVIATLVLLSSIAGVIWSRSLRTRRIQRRLEAEVSARTAELRSKAHSLEREIAEHQRTEEQRLELEHNLLHAQKMDALGRLAGGIAHDFNNLLTTITGYTSLLGDRLPDADGRYPEVMEIDRAAERAAELTRKLLTFSRKHITQPRRVDLNQVVRDVSRMLRRLIGEDVALTTRLSPAQIPIELDPVQLEQVLINLATNARDAMPDGGSLMITTWVLERPSGDMAMLEVRDDGIGMDAEVRARVFEPFFTTKDEGKGTGLGLSTVYGIVKQHEGFLELDTAPGEGCAVRVSFPLADGLSEPEVTDLAATSVDAAGETVLVVEDEAEVRRLVAELLRSGGYRVLEAENGGAAMEHCRGYQGPIELVLTDVVMPGQDGPEVVRRLRQVRPELAVVYMSGYSAERFEASGVPADAGFLNKPFSRGALLGSIRRALDRAAAPRAGS